MKKQVVAIAVAAAIVSCAASASAANFFRQLRIDSLMSDGVDLYHRGDYPGSLSKFDAVVALAADNNQAHYDRALDLYALGRYNDASTELRACVTRDPAMIPAWFNLGVVDIAQEDFVGAKAIFSKIIAAHSNSMRAHFDLGLANYLDGQSNEAAKNFAVATLLHPAYVQAHYDLALAEYRSGNLVAADKEAGEALKLSGSYAKVYFLRGAIRLRQGDGAHARAEFGRAARLATDPVLKSLCDQIIAQIGV
ncbi:MAG: tetratricopeptide repeat protein [Candidatus Eremiobacteraeota bacterium]|nr:tetratricopeptide repeat protein [Candidatus Eremiobacteraeota bacterium]MBC5827817.1 tetratricopeptide repeat protein [Candidatus Eremiobacteraeota bacterium]